MAPVLRHSAAVLAAALLAACGGGGGGATVVNVTVTASGTNVTVTPITAQPFGAGGTAGYTVVADTGYTRDSAVGGSCPAGSFSGNAYTTGIVTGNCTVNFSATRNSYNVTAAGTNVSLAPSGAQAVLHGDAASVTVTADSGYTRSSAVGGSCAAGSFSGNVYTSGAITATCTLSFSADANPALALGRSQLTLATDGAARTVTLTNTGGLPATGLSVDANPALPAGTVAGNNCGSSLNPAATCTLTITPGATPSAAPGDLAPAPVVVTVSASNASAVTFNVDVVTFGSVLQGGYVFAIDDTTATTGSIGGKVAALTDQAPAFPNGVAWADSGVVTDYLGEDAVSPPDACNAATDGACASARIVAANSPPDRVPAADPTSYAAGLCTATIAGRSDWHLPAACELSYSEGALTGCGGGSGPRIPNLQSNLVERGDIGGLSGRTYWSSTQSSAGAATDSWTQFFNPLHVPASVQARGTLLAVRCVRALTP